MSGDDKPSLGVQSGCSLHFGKGSPALRQVANLANKGRFSAKPADETDEIDDAREERELSVTMDSGEEFDEVFERASDGRRLLGKWYASKPVLMLGLNWSIHERAMDEPWTCAIAKDMDGRLELAAGVPEADNIGVRQGVGSGPKRTPHGVGGSGLGSRKRGAWYLVGVGVLS